MMLLLVRLHLGFLLNVLFLVFICLLSVVNLNFYVMIIRLISHQMPRFSRPVTRENETIVQNGLAVTPRDMLDMTQRGIPITPSNLGLQYDSGYSDLDFNPPLEYTRGVDIGILWEEKQNAKQKIKAGLKKLSDQLKPE